MGLEKNKNFQAEELNTSQSAERIQDGQLDAFLTVTGAPSSGIAQLAAVAGLRLLSIPEDVRPRKDQPYYHVLAENEQTTYVAYVSEQNLLVDGTGEPCRHPLVDELFGELVDGQYALREHQSH